MLRAVIQLQILNNIIMNIIVSNRTHNEMMYHSSCVMLVLYY